MGLIKAGIDAVMGTLKDQWKEYFYCEALPVDVLVSKGQKKVQRGGNKGDDNAISDGSVIAVADGQFIIIVENGLIVDFSGEPGEFVYRNNVQPSLFSGDDGLGEKLKKTFSQIGKRFTFGGETPGVQRVYFFNKKEIMGNKYGTPNPVPFRVVDKNIGLDVDISIRCHGEYSYRISDPMLFYKNVCGNIEYEYKRSQIDSQLKSELMTALQPAFAKISEMGIRYSALPGHTFEIADALNEVLSKRWREKRGIEIVEFGVNGVNASAEDEAMIKDLQKKAVYRNADMAVAGMVDAQNEALVGAANNKAGAMQGFMAMGMMQGGGGSNVSNLLMQQQQMKQQQQMQQQTPPAPKAGWTCSCGAVNTAKFCAECGKPQPAPKASWTCSCGAVNTGKFCAECGNPQPAPKKTWTCSCGAVNTGKFCAECGAKQPQDLHYKCDKCGWEPEAGAKIPKFCPECGDPINENDLV